jgi:hypothetical protein
MDELDLRNTRPRLIRLGTAAVIGAILTFFAIKATMSSGRGPNADPIGQGSVIFLAIAVFVVTTMLSHRVLSRQRR